MKVIHVSAHLQPEVTFTIALIIDCLSIEVLFKIFVFILPCADKKQRTNTSSGITLEEQEIYRNLIPEFVITVVSPFLWKFFFLIFLT